MILLLDAYNILRYLSPRSIISETEKNNFLKKLGIYAIKKGHSIIAIFDGGSSKYPYTENDSHIRIVYSGTEISADEIIIQMAADKQHNEILLVSMDRKLCEIVEQYNVPTIDPEYFWPYVQALFFVPLKNNEKTTSHTRKNKHHVSDEDYDKLMEEAARSMIYKDVYNKPVVNKTPLKKREKKLMNLIKKL